MLVAFLPVINHLLNREPWARERLAPFAGRVVALDMPPLGRFAVRIADQGFIENAATLGASEASADLQINVPAQALANAFNDRDALLRAMHVAGNAEFAAAVQYVARHLRWDAEDDLARFVGDIPARRIAQLGASLFAWQREARDRLGANVAEYVTEEAAIAARAPDVKALATDIAALDQRLIALETRLNSLDSRRV
jgi:ubiquinone biosynthesis accessory factor UbiJ